MESTGQARVSRPGPFGFAHLGPMSACSALTLAGRQQNLSVTCAPKKNGLLRFYLPGHGSKSKSYREHWCTQPNPVPPTTKIGSEMGGEFTYQPKWDSLGLEPQPPGYEGAKVYAGVSFFRGLPKMHGM